MQVRCTVQLEASFAAAAVGAIILLLSPFMMTLTVDVLTHSIHMLRPWFSSMLWRSLASNFTDFDDFGLNFVNFSCTQQSDAVKTNAAYDHYYT